MTWRRGVLGGWLIAVLLTTSGCGRSWPHVVIPGVLNHVTETSPDMALGERHLFASMVLCLDRPGSASVTAVRPVRPQGGMRIVEFGLRPSPFWRHRSSIADAPGGLKANHFRAGRTIPVTCDPRTGRGYELGVVVARTGAGAGVAHGLQVEYLSDGHRGELVFPLTLVLCPHAIRADDSCAGATAGRGGG